MIQTCAFLLIAPRNHSSKFGGPRSVVWNTVPINYIREGQLLESLLQETWKFIAKKIDETGDMIMKELESFSYNDLLALDDAHIELATVNHPEQKRG